MTRVRALLEKANSVGDVVMIESELTQREADLESSQRRLAAGPPGAGKAPPATRRHPGRRLAPESPA